MFEDREQIQRRQRAEERKAAEAERREQIVTAGDHAAEATRLLWQMADLTDGRAWALSMQGPSDILTRIKVISERAKAHRDHAEFLKRLEAS